MYQKYVALRDKKGVTDALVAKETGIGKSTFSDWKNGRSVPKLDKLQKIANFLEVPIESFFENGISLQDGRIADEIAEGETYYISTKGFEETLIGILHAAQAASCGRKCRIILDYDPAQSQTAISVVTDT